VKREPSPLATLVFLLVTLPLMFAQDLQTQPSPALPSDILGPQLIAWSQIQKPQPVPQPLLLPDRRTQQPDEQPAGPSARQEQSAAPTVTGTIMMKSGTRYVLKVSSDSAYQLDDEDGAKQYENKYVKVDGALNADGKSLHITSIEVVS
jgi:hypothetical protein